MVKAAIPKVAASAIPITLLTGFLGSGKTTLLNGLLRTAEFSRTAVIINEFGDIDLDHDLLEASSDDVQVLTGGCLCCTVRGSLVETLHSLYVRRELGEVTEFENVVIETSGLADPSAISTMLEEDPMTFSRFHLAATVVLVDAVNGHRTLEAHPVARRQVVTADLLVATKTDVAEAAAEHSVGAVLATLNSKAATFRFRQKDPEEMSRLAKLIAKFRGRLRDIPLASKDRASEAASGHAKSDYKEISVTTMERIPPVTEAWLEACVAELEKIKGPSLLRAKGIIAVQGRSAPVVIQAVQDIIDPPMPLAEWPSQDHRSRLVLIMHRPSRDAIEALCRRLEFQPYRAAQA